MSPVERNGLRRHRGRFVDPAEQVAYARLMRDVLALEIDIGAPSGPWTHFAVFAPNGRCVGNVEAALPLLVLDGVRTTAAGIRSVAVDPDWRGRGLFRDLMTEALAWCEAGGAAATFLYTEDPSLYGRFDFHPLPQHIFVGQAPAHGPGAAPRRLDLGQAADRAIIRTLVERRAPVSAQCALDIDAAQFMANVAKDDGLSLAYVAEAQTLIVYEADADELVIADVVAPVMPSLATVLAMLGARTEGVKILFPPDKLGWRGTPVSEETGLMIRGEVPGAMTRPFTFPPTAEF